MAGTNIGRVEFIVDLDGDKLPAQARRLGRQIAAAGKDAGKDFGENFETEFDKSLTSIGKRAATSMEKSGKLAGENFGDAIERSLARRKASIQSTLADTLVDKDALQKAFLSFESGSEALDHFGRELSFLGDDAKMFDVTLLEALETTDAFRESMKQTEAETERLRKSQQDLNDEIDRMTSLSRDSSAVRQAAIAQGTSYRTVVRQMREEMEGLNQTQDVSNIQLQRFSDNLERTVEAIEKEDAAAARVAQEKIDRDEKVAASAEKLSQRQRLASLKAQDAFDAGIKKEKEANETHKDSSGVIDKLAGSFRRMDGTVKLVIVSILAAADEVAVLGSALGAGVIALGGALSAIAVGGGGLIGLFSQLNDELDDLPVALRPAAKEFQALGKTFEDVGEAISTAAVGNLGKGFGQIDDNIRNLIPGLAEVGGMIGTLIDDFGQATKKGTNAFRQIDKAIENGIPNFDSLARTAGDFGVALVRGINKAQPLVEDLLGWIRRLTDQFDAFTRSAGFDEWIGNAQTTFGAFGKLLDAVGRGFNDLVTPESVARTEEFIDNLTDFIPHLTTMLDAFGDFDAFGLVAQALADFGAALAPLAEPTAELAEALNDLLSEAIRQFAELAGGVAPVLAVLVSGFGDWIAAMDPGTVQFLAGAVAALAISFGALNAVIGISALVKGFQALSTQASKLGPAANLAAGGIGKLAKAALKLGGVVAILGIVGQSFKALSGSADMVAPGIEQITQSLAAGGGIDSAFVNAAASVDTFGEAIKSVAGPDIASGLQRFNSSLGGIIGIRTPVNDAADSIAALDATLANMIATGDVSKAEANFAALKVQAEKQGVSVEELTKKFPQYTEALAGADNASKDAQKGFEGIADEAGITLRSIEDLADAIEGFGDTQLTANEAQREFAASIDDVTESVKENGTAWGVSSEQGRANMEAIDGIAEAALKNASAIKENTGSQELANAALKDGHDRLIEQLAQFGITGQAAEDYAKSVGLSGDSNQELIDKTKQAHIDLVNQLETFGLTGAEAETYATKLEEIPGEVPTTIEILGKDQAITDANSIKTAIDKAAAPRSAIITVKAIGQDGQPIYQIPGGARFTAAGALLTRATHVVAGEAGPEAIVPLNRPLNQVDPAVRALSAYAQGLGTPQMAGGGAFGPTSSTSRILNINEGAIVVQGASAPEATATMTVNRIAERIAG